MIYASVLIVKGKGEGYWWLVVSSWWLVVRNSREQELAPTMGKELQFSGMYSIM